MSIQLNGSATSIVNGVQLTTNGIYYSAGSFFYKTKKPCGTFTIDFDYLSTGTDPYPADGFTLTLQNSVDGDMAVGDEGYSLAYQFSVTPSFCFTTKTYIYNSVGFGQNGFFTGSDVLPGSIELLGKVIHYHIDYDGTTFTVTMSQIGHPNFSISNMVDLPTVLGGNLAFVGCTGSTGGYSSTQTITNFVFRSRIPCLHENTLVPTFVKGKVIMRPINTLRANDTVVGLNNVPIKLVNNARFSSSDTFIKIAKDALGPNTPSDDLFIRKGHPILHNGKEILPESLLKKNKDITQITLPKRPVWSLCTKGRLFVLMQGVPVCTWDYDELMSKQTKYFFELF